MSERAACIYGVASQWSVPPWSFARDTVCVCVRGVFRLGVPRACVCLLSRAGAQCQSVQRAYTVSRRNGVFRLGASHVIRCVCVCEGCSALESHVRASVTVCLSVCVAVGVRRAVCIVIVDFALYEKNVHQPWPLALKCASRTVATQSAQKV